MVLAVVVVYALIQVRLVVIPALLALILAAAIAPFVHWLRRRGWPSSLATTASFLVLLLAFGGLITGIVFAVMGQAGRTGQQGQRGVRPRLRLRPERPLPDR